MIETKIVRVDHFVKDGQHNIKLTFNSEFDGFVKDETTGEYVTTKVNNISLSEKQIKRAANICSPLLSYFLSFTKLEEMSFEQITNLLLGANVKLERTLVPAGTSYINAAGVTVATTRDSYKTEFVGWQTNELNEAVIFAQPIGRELVMKALGL